MPSKYSDIISVPYPKEDKRFHMSTHDRAAQFSPFAALTGYEAAVKETARLTTSKKLLCEDKASEIDLKLKLIYRLYSEYGVEIPITITYFISDRKKRGGEYISASGIIKKIDSYKKIIYMSDSRQIPIKDIADICADIIDLCIET